MLTLYRRHLQDCGHQSKGRQFKRCRCPVWIQGTIEGKPLRRSLDVTSWDRAEGLKYDLEHGKTEQELTIEVALEKFLSDCQARNLTPSTLAKYRLLGRKLTAFAERQALTQLSQLDAQAIRNFRQTRILCPRTAAKELERIRAFLSFHVQNGWLKTNAAKAIKAPQIKVAPRIPFHEKEIQNILAHAKDDRELAFLLVLRHTGLRIGDAALLRTSALGDNRIHLYTTKAGVPVSILIPDQLLTLLTKIPPHGGYFFVRAESTSMHTCADLWRRRIKILCKAAGVMPDHPHRFRHSLAADLLSKGASVEDVAAILGNSPAIVMKHYSQFVQARQDRLDSFLEKTWAKKLVRVK